jgi:hypothetical protein
MGATDWRWGLQTGDGGYRLGMRAANLELRLQTGGGGYRLEMGAIDWGWGL